VAAHHRLMRYSRGDARGAAMILFDTNPDRYRHWRLAYDGAVATLALDVAEDGGLPAIN
jgi:benzoyl-CoA-dihydrodiol lyase